MIRYFKAIAFAGALVAGAAALGDEPAVARLAISKRQFSPAQLALPAGVRVKLLVRNDGSLPAEFESYDLSREVVVPAGTEVTIYVGPLKPGRYKFFNDFDQAVQGWVVVGEPAKKP